jgi:hypothetical protein
MRNNLLALGLALVMVALLVKMAPAPAPRIVWEASFWLHEPDGFYCSWLEMENDRYRISSQGCTGAGVGERGRIERLGDRLVLVSDEGEQRSYTLKGGSLRNSEGHDFPARYVGVPRLHPDSHWLRADIPLELDGVKPGMTRSEVLAIYPESFPDENGALVARPKSESRSGRITFVIDRAGKVERIGGIRLSQAGRPLLNECSTRREVEALFGRLKWKMGQPNSFGTAARAHYGGLEITVHQIVGMRPEEAGVSSLVLARQEE